MYWNIMGAVKKGTLSRLIETWDVLKYKPLKSFIPVFLWLIETWDVLKYDFMAEVDSALSINRNMRCIEIRWESPWPVRYVGLIETWDVLKLVLCRNWWLCPVRLIETWDVLKFPKLSAVIAIRSINRNMGCIEI